MRIALTSGETIGTQELQRLGFRDVLLWSAALVVVAAVQAIGAYGLLSSRPPAELPGAPPPAIMIELSEISVAPQVEDIAAEDGELALEQEAATPVESTSAEPVSEVEPIEPLEPTEVTEPVLEPTEPQRLETAEAELPEPAQQETAEPVEAAEAAPVEPIEAAEPVETELQETLPETVEPIEEVIPDLIESETAEAVIPMPRTMPSALERKRQEFAEARREEERKPEPKTAEKPRPQPQQPQAASRQTAPQSVEAESSDRPAASQETTTTKRTPNVSPQKWQSQVIAKLNRAKRYPPQSRRNGEEGVPQVQFSIDRSGNVLSVRLVRSSGFPALDAAAIDMVNRASPVPAPPASIPDNRVTLTVPVNFNLK